MLTRFSFVKTVLERYFSRITDILDHLRLWVFVLWMKLLIQSRPFCGILIIWFQTYSRLESFKVYLSGSTQRKQVGFLGFLQHVG